jgi:uncharacterized YccA/Bax inhibitor family protein
MANPFLTREFDRPAAEPASPAAPASDRAPGAVSGGVMTRSSVTLATGALLALVVGGAVFGWHNHSAISRWWWLIVIGLLALVLAAVFVPRVAPATGVVYSLVSGALLGAISKDLEDSSDGIVFVALTATVVVFVVALVLYVSGVIRVTQRFQGMLRIAVGGVGLLYFVTLVVSWFGTGVPLVTGSGPGAIVFSLFVIGIVSLELMLDFDVIERGIAAGAPRQQSWFAAFGLITSIVWVYIEILRLLANLARRSR